MSETAEMVERVARALCRRHIKAARFWDTPDMTEEQLERGVDHAWPEFADPARVAILAMCDPTDAMLDAGWPHTADPCWRDDVGRAWTAMIGAALGAGQAEGEG